MSIAPVMENVGFGRRMEVSTLGAMINLLSHGQENNLLGCKVCCDSRKVEAGDIFFAIRGVHVDGHDFVGEALARGACMVVAERAVSVPKGVSLVVVENSAAALGESAQAERGFPADELIALGVTGTKGKTTVAYLVRAMLQAEGVGCGLVGTVEYDLGETRLKADNTTPDALRLAEMMGRMRDHGLGAVVMECSSHALDQERTAGINFKAAAFTNLTGDHLDYHVDREAYKAAKRKLFEGLSKQAVAVLNRDDAVSVELAQATEAEVWWYGIEGKAEIRADMVSAGLCGCEFVLRLCGQEEVRVRTGLLGVHNVSNCLAAAGLARAAGAGVGSIAAGIGSLGRVPGRLEQIDCGQDFRVFVDYAHTDDALRRVLETVRGIQPRKVILVFGCGGDRDRTKRPRMAAVAEEWADRIILTNDNPRTESPDAIVAEIGAGFSAQGVRKVAEVLDRASAIELALRTAEAGDVVLIAGKGHEDCQIIGEKRYHFDDREIVREILRRGTSEEPSRGRCVSAIGQGRRQ